MGNKSFYGIVYLFIYFNFISFLFECDILTLNQGPNGIVDSSSKITIITQFITDDNTDDGELVEIRRIYKQV